MTDVDLTNRFEEIQQLVFAQKYTAADERIGRLAGEYPDSAPVYYLQALSNLHQGRAIESEVAAHRALALDPRDADTLYLLSGAQLEQRHHEAALESIAEAIGLDPTRAYFHARRAQVYVAEERLGQAEQAARAGLACDPNSESCRNLLALVLNLRGQRGAAIDEIENLLALNPNNPTAHANAGYVALRAGNIDAARRHFVEALRLSPTDDFARGGLAEVIKAANPLYRYFLRFSVWMGETATRYRWSLIVGIVVLVWFVPVLVPIYLVFVLWTYFANPLANAFLQLHPTGRYLIEKGVRPYVVATIACLALAVVAGGLAWLTPAVSLRFLAYAGLLAVLPLDRLVLASHQPAAARFAYSWLAVAAALGVLGALAPQFGWGVGAFESLFLLAAVAYSWLGNLVR